MQDMIQSSPARLLRSLRRNAGLTQRELARRARTSQSVIARIENGTASPGWKTLEHLVHCAGFQLQLGCAPRSGQRSHMLEDVPRILSLSPEQRLTELRNAARFIGAARRIDAGHL